MFQVMTGESWSEMVARPLLFGWSGAGTAIFYVTFILLMQASGANPFHQTRPPCRRPELPATGTNLLPSASTSCHTPTALCVTVLAC